MSPYFCFVKKKNCNKRYQYPQGKPWPQEALPPFPPQGAGYLTLLSRHSLGNRTMVMLPLLSLRWGINKNTYLMYVFYYFLLLVIFNEYLFLVIRKIITTIYGSC